MPLTATPPPARGTAGLIAGLLFIAGPLLAWLGLVQPLVGFGLFALGGLVAIVASVLTLRRLVRGRGMGRGGVVAVIVAIAFVALAARNGNAPRINDFTTDLADPPAFVHAATIPANAGRDLSYPADFAATQRSCCPDLHPARLRGGSDEAFARARRVAEGMPAWTIVAADPSGGIIEAVATSRMFRFADDIVIRVRPDGGGQSRVDMRSKSRDGKGDMGVNAARIRRYIDALEATATEAR
jgi:uncharacterized protein (DUF1499 family)